MAKGCRLCAMNKGHLDTVCETSFFNSHLDRHPETPGHAIIVPKRHVVSLFDLKNGEWDDLQAAIKRTAKAIGRLDLKAEYARFIADPYSKESKAICKGMLKNPGLRKRADGYNIGVNEGRAAGRTIDHLHIHLIPRHFGDVGAPEGGVRNVIKNAKY